MAYTVNWVTKVVSIPHTDLTLVSGNIYELSLTDFWIEIRRLEAEPAQGLWAPKVLEHTNSVLNFAGVDYPPFDKVINGYTITFTGPVDRVNLLGSNNNIVDVLNVNGVSVVPSNSAGLQRVSTGSGLSASEQAQLQTVFNNLDNIEGTITHQEAMRVILAAAAGLARDADVNAPKFRDTTNTKDRITAVTDEHGNRTSVVLDVS